MQFRQSTSNGQSIPPLTPPKDIPLQSVIPWTPAKSTSESYQAQVPRTPVPLQHSNHKRKASVMSTYAAPLAHPSQDKIEDKQPRGLTWSDFWQFLRFCSVGSLNAVIDFVVLDLLLWIYPTTNTEKILLYNSLAVLLASTNSFFCNKYWTFQQRQAITSQEIGRFVVIAGATTIMNDGLIFLLSAFFPGAMNSTLIGTNILKLGAIIGTMSISFFGMRLWVFLQGGHANSKPITNNMLTTSLVTTSVHISDMPTVKVSVPNMMPVTPIPQVPFTPLPDSDFISQLSTPAWLLGPTIHSGQTAIVLVEIGKEAGHVFEISKASLSIGRISENDIFLDDPAISRLHASILNERGENYVLIDESSANGTKVNGQMVEKYQRHQLRDGDKIQLGATVLVFTKHLI